MLTTWLAKIACHLLGNIYAAYASYKAVLSSDAEQHKQWLSYWIVNTVFVLFEIFADALISWLPLYFEAKLAFVVWLTFYNGASVLYDRIVHKYIAMYERDIDAQLSKLQQGATKVMGTVTDQVGSHIRNHSATIASSLLQHVAAAQQSADTHQPPAQST